MARARFDEERKAQFLYYLREGEGKAQACALVGISPTTLRRALQSDQDFAEEYESVIALVTEAVEKALFTSAVKGNVEAQKFWLKNRAAEEWSDVQRVEHTGRGGGPVMIAAAATQSLREMLQEREVRSAAIDFIDVDLAPGSGGALEEDRVSGELGPSRQPRGVEASEAPDGAEPAGP